MLSSCQVESWCDCLKVVEATLNSSDSLVNRFQVWPPYLKQWGSASAPLGLVLEEGKQHSLWCFRMEGGGSWKA